MPRKKTLGFNWRQSPAHLWFLTTFLVPREDDPTFQDIDWAMALGEETGAAIRRFLVQGVLVKAPLAVRAEKQFTVAELKTLLQQANLSAKGNKAELINRLINEGTPALKQWVTLDVFQCKDYGRELAEKYLEDPTNFFADDANSKNKPLLVRQDASKVAKWLLAEGIVLGVLGNAVYDWLKSLAAELIDEIGKPKSPRIARVRTEVKLTWCTVPAGYFLMGSKEKDAKWDNEKPQHRVYLPTYRISQFPVTNLLYSQFVKATGYKVPSNWENGSYPTTKRLHPVVRVSWHDTNEFCRWATQELGTTVRLPTEAEWEKAARGTDGRLYPWGNQWNLYYCNTRESGIGDTTPVDQYPQGRSPYDCYDMAGNVWEWTSSLFKPYPYNKNDGRENISLDGIRCVRGGSWDDARDSARVADRSRHNPNYSHFIIGFRVLSPVF